MKPAKRSKIFFSAVLITLIFGCGGQGIDEEKLSKIYVEDLIARESIKNNPDSLKTRIDEIFRSNGTTKEEFQKAIEMMKGDPVKWDAFFGKARKYLDELKVNKTIE